MCHACGFAMSVCRSLAEETHRRGTRLCILCLCVALPRKRHIHTWRTFVYATSLCLFLERIGAHHIGMTQLYEKWNTDAATVI